MSEKGQEKQVGKTDTRMIDESFISQNRFVGVAQQMDGWLVLRQNPPAATSKLGVPIAQCAGSIRPQLASASDRLAALRTRA